MINLNQILGFRQSDDDLIRPLLGVSSGPTPYTGVLIVVSLIRPINFVR